MIRAAITSLLVVAPSAAAAQMAATPAANSHAGHNMPTPAPVADPHAGHAMPMAPPPPTAYPHAGHDMGAAKPDSSAATADPHAGHNMAAPPTGDTIGTEPAPAAPTDHAADAIWGAAAIAPSRAALRR